MAVAPSSDVAPGGVHVTVPSFSTAADHLSQMMELPIIQIKLKPPNQVECAQRHCWVSDQRIAPPARSLLFVMDTLLLLIVGSSFPQASCGWRKDVQSSCYPLTLSY